MDSLVSPRLWAACVTCACIKPCVTRACIKLEGLGPITLHPGVTQKRCPFPTTVAREAEGASLPRESRLPEPHSLYGVLLFSASPDCIRLPAPLPSATASSFSSFLPPLPSPSPSPSPSFPSFPFTFLPLLLSPSPSPSSFPSSPQPSSILSEVLELLTRVPLWPGRFRYQDPFIPSTSLPPPRHPSPQGAGSRFLWRHYMEKSWASPKLWEWGPQAVLSSHCHPGVTSTPLPGAQRGRAKA